MRQQDADGEIQRLSSLSPSGARVANARQPGVQEDIHAGPEDLSVSDAPHLLEQSTAAASDKRPLPSAVADAASDLHVDPREQASDIFTDTEMHLNITTAQGSTEAHPAVLDPPPELNSIRTSPPSASLQDSIAFDDTEYPADLHSTPSASHSPSDAASELSAQDNGQVLGNDALGNAHSTSGTIGPHQQSLLLLKSPPLDLDLASQLPSEASLAVAQLDSSKDEDSTEGTDTGTAKFAAAKKGSEPPETDTEEQESPCPEQAARHSQSSTAALTHLANPQADSDAWAGIAASSFGDSANAQTAAAGSCLSPEAGSAGSCKPQEGSDSDTGTQPVPAASPAASVVPQDGSASDTQTEAIPGTSFTASASPKGAAEMGMGTEGVPGISLSSSDSPQIQRQGSNAEASTRGLDDTKSGNSPAKHMLAGQADAQGGTSQSWRQQRKHVFVLSNAGKPIWTLHGDENALAGLMAVIQALISFVHDKGDTMQSIRAGTHLIIFLERGPFILVMASATGEPEAALTCQLGLVHAQILSILSSSVDKMFARNPSYDARKLLGATSHVLTALVASFDYDPSAMLMCLVPLPLKSNLRHCALVYLQSAVKSAGALFGVLLTQKAIVAVAQSRAHVLHPHDLLLLANLVRSNESFKQAQTFTPVCLPHFNSAAFLHAYVQYLHVSGGVCLVLLSSQAESFFNLADAAQQVHRQLKQPGVLQAIISVTEHQTDGGLLSISDLPPQCGGGQVGMTPLLHFLYKSPTRGQVIMPAFDAPLDRHELQLATMQRYAIIHAAMTQKAGLSSSSKAALAANTSYGSLPSQQSLQQQVHWRSDGSMSALAYAGPDCEGKV
ncbi:hypothetical protein WJX77_005361 [Trebouxia sp. C0004]